MPDRERLYRTEGVVLKRNDFGEADRMLVVMTPRLGKLRVLAKGVRKVPSRRAGHIEPFMRSEFLVARGRSLDIVTQAEVIETQQGLRRDLLRTTYACYMAELVDSFVGEGEENGAVYDLLVGCLRCLSAGDDPALLARFFELRLLACVGYRPELQRCVHCGAQHQPGRAFFCPADGGVRCVRCGEGASGGVEISLRAFKVLRYLQDQEYAAVVRLQLSTETAREVEMILRRYFTYILERNLKSVNLLSLVRDGAEPRPTLLDEPSQRE